MFSGLLYLVLGSGSLFVGITGRGLRPEPGKEAAAKKAQKLLVFCGVVLLIGALWEFVDQLL